MGSSRALAEAAQAAGVPLDITVQTAVWGGAMRATEAFVLAVGTADYERGTDDRHSGELIQAHLLQTLSAIGRECLDLYLLRVRKSVEEFQISGALESLEMARQEGYIRHVGICCDGPEMATLGVWQFHDAFEVLLAPPTALTTLAPLAAQRRVGVLTLADSPIQGSTTLVPVRSPEDVAKALA